MTAQPVIDLPTPRDYAAEMRAVIASEPDEIAAIAAARIVAKLRAVDPDLLAGWLDLGAVGFVRTAIGQVDRSDRSRARTAEARAAFGRDAEAGDTSQFLAVRYVVDDDNSRRALGECGRDELLFVAKAYDSEARTARMEAAFFRAVAKRVGAGVVADHFTEEQIRDLRRSITG